MIGPPSDAPSECNAHLYLADDYGDNTCTCRCRLEPGHKGMHREEFKRDGHPVLIEWEQDERGVEDDDGEDGE